MVAAGGIGTPVILRASGYPAAGSDYFFDPLIIVMGVVEGLSGGREFPMAAGIHLEDEGYMMTDLVLPRFIFQSFSAYVLQFRKLFSHARVLPIMIKIRDTLGGRLTDSGGVRKRLSEADEKKLDSGYHRAEEILKNAGAKGIFKSHLLATHPGGTVKIGHIVDSDLKTDIDNLYVCDCSVIPEDWGLPPSLTILALGKRLAKHLINEHQAAPGYH